MNETVFRNNEDFYLISAKMDGLFGGGYFTIYLRQHPLGEFFHDAPRSCSKTVSNILNLSPTSVDNIALKAYASCVLCKSLTT